MSYKLAVNQKNKILFVTFTGKLTKLDIFSLALNARSYIKDESIRKVVVDLRDCAGRLNLFDSLDLAGTYPAFLKEFRIAILDIEENIEKSRMHEKIAHNRGFSIVCFTNQEDAEDWLENK
ncbi:MAG: hypothetical protein IAE90_01065 [Ignavibacteria bacterium]|nr:hypothetical protein [Ignavibacteria bacterium]